MGKKVYILGVALMCCLQSPAQWQQININTVAHFKHISFINDSVGIITSNQVLLITSNQGNTWDTLYYNANHYLGDVQFLNDSTIYLDVYPMTGPGFLKKTFDLGNTWTDVTTAGNQMFFVSPLTGFVTHPFAVFKTTDGAVTWDNGMGAGSGAVGNIHFFNNNVGYIASSYPGAISVTTDGGITWQTQAAIEGIDVFAPSPNIAYMAGWFGQMQKTTDMGNTWTILNTGVSSQAQMRSVYCPDNNTCYVVGDDGNIIKTSDGGANWTPQFSGSNRLLQSVWCINNDICFAVGDSGTIIKTINGGVGIPEIKKETIQVFPNPTNDGIVQVYLQQNTLLTVSVFNSNGQQMLNKSNFRGGSLDLSSLENGLYSVHFATAEGVTSTHQVLIIK